MSSPNDKINKTSLQLRMVMQHEKPESSLEFIESEKGTKRETTS